MGPRSRHHPNLNNHMLNSRLTPAKPNPLTLFSFLGSHVTLPEEKKSQRVNLVCPRNRECA